MADHMTRCARARTLLPLALCLGLLLPRTVAAQALADDDDTAPLRLTTLHVAPVETLRSGAFRLVAAAGLPRFNDQAFADGFRRGALAALARPEHPTSEAAFEAAADAAVEVPASFALRGNYPNPFNPATRLSLDLPEAATVSVDVYDVLGRRVLVVPEVALAAGVGRSLMVDASMLPSGVYLYRVQAEMARGTETATGRMTLLR